ncbi:hypothetical protein IWX90DRAFT_187895 [Phyllosticta citrichinensis]|uniref:Uncharacterized protein n=1 Tax=Phyllosticta citrichinensis TaxID=1130410 RepID=A0ABR1XWR1_9PEZI
MVGLLPRRGFFGCTTRVENSALHVAPGLVDQVPSFPSASRQPPRWLSYSLSVHLPRLGPRGPFRVRRCSFLWPRFLFYSSAISGFVSSSGFPLRSPRRCTSIPKPDDFFDSLHGLPARAAPTAPVFQHACRVCLEFTLLFYNTLMAFGLLRSSFSVS